MSVISCENYQGSLVRKLPNYERWSQLAVPPSCQPHHVWGIGNAWIHGWSTLGRNFLCFFRVKWPSVVAAGGSLFLRFRGSIRKVVDKCARDCSESSISHKNRQKLTGPDYFFKMRSTKCARDCIERVRFHIKLVKKNWRGRTTFWRWGRQNVHETV